MTTTVGKYLVRRLEEIGLAHVFGIPGDYVLGFYDLLVESKMKIIGTCTEQGAAFAADGYARVNGVGCVCVTYCVGGLNALNAVAGAFAENSPVILITGAPGLNERVRSPLLHHVVRDFDTQRRIFENVTVAAVALEDPARAPEQIDETIAACLRHKRPVFIEIPRDVVNLPCDAPPPWKPDAVTSDAATRRECVDEAVAMLRAAKSPAILAGVQIHRWGLQKSLVRLVERANVPVAATLLGKSVISELHPNYVGVYEGGVGQERAREVIESADCLIIAGAPLTDIDLGIFTANLNPSRCIYASAERITIKRHHYTNVALRDFIERLTRARLGYRRTTVRPRKPAPPPPPYVPRPHAKMTVRRFFDRMNEFIGDDTVVVADIGDSLFGSADLTIHRRTEFISPAFYTSMGFATPAALGVQIKRPRLRPVVFVGDGAFQMTGHEISTIARYKLNPIVFVLNNRGYTTERFIREGPYNDVHEWAYHLWPQIVRDGWGCEVRTEGEFEHALAQASGNRVFSIINVHLETLDHSLAMERLARRLGKRTQMKATVKRRNQPRRHGDKEADTRKKIFNRRGRR